MENKRFKDLIINLLDEEYSNFARKFASCLVEDDDFQIFQMLSKLYADDPGVFVDNLITKEAAKVFGEYENPTAKLFYGMYCYQFNNFNECAAELSLINPVDISPPLRKARNYYLGVSYLKLNEHILAEKSLLDNIRNRNPDEWSVIKYLESIAKSASPATAFTSGIGIWINMKWADNLRRELMRYFTEMAKSSQALGETFDSSLALIVCQNELKSNDLIKNRILNSLKSKRKASERSCEYSWFANTDFFNFDFIASMMKDARILVIGANDGIRFDPVFPLFRTTNGWRGVFIEPIPEIFEQLKYNYKWAGDRAFLINCALWDSDGFSEINFVDTKKISNGELPYWKWGVASMFEDKNALKKHKNLSQKIRVETKTLASIMSNSSLKSLDIVHVDAEGIESLVIDQLFKIDQFPNIINIEYINMSPNEWRHVIKHLSKHKYIIKKSGNDLLAVKSEYLSLFLDKTFRC